MQEVKAMVKVLLERHVHKNDYEKMTGFLNDIRAKALRQPGYISGETLVKGDEPVDVLTIGTWISEEHWQAWFNSEARAELDNIISALILGEPTINVYKIAALEDDVE
jgi:heme oxygenase (mycobilin-producing)